MRKMKEAFRVTVRIKKEQKDALDTLSNKTRVPISEYIREGIDLSVSRNYEPLTKKAIRTIRGESIKKKESLRVNFYIKKEQKDALDILSRKTRVPISEYIREGIDLAVIKIAPTLLKPPIKGRLRELKGTMLK